MDKKTTIQVTQTTKNHLASLGKKGDSFEDIVCFLLTYYEKNKE